MGAKRTTLTGVLALVLTACGSAVTPPASSQTVTAPSVSAAATPSLPPTATAKPTPKPNPKPTPVPVPPKPSDVTFEIQGGAPDPQGYPGDVTMTVTWRTPRTTGVEIRVFGVTQCFPAPADSGKDDGPCLVEHTPLPEAVRRLVADAPASAGVAKWTWPGWENIGSSVMMGPDGTTYESVVIAAYNASGHSIFAIAAPGYWCSDCTY